MEVTFARSAIGGAFSDTLLASAGEAVESALVEVVFDSLGFAEEVGGVLIGDVDEFFESFDGGFELVVEFVVFGVLPGIAEGGEAGLEGGEVVLEVAVETFKFLRETAHLIGVHDCLSHGDYIHEEVVGLKRNVP